MLGFDDLARLDDVGMRRRLGLRTYSATALRTRSIERGAVDGHALLLGILILMRSSGRAAAVVVGEEALGAADQSGSIVAAL